MSTGLNGHRRTDSARPWWIPAAYSAAAAAAIAALFNPVPAMADPAAAEAATVPGAVPDIGSRPTSVGSLMMPGQAAKPSTAATTLYGADTNPILKKVQKGRDEIAALGNELDGVKQDRDDAKKAEDAAEAQYTQSVQALSQAQAAADQAAAADVRAAAAMPPGAYDSGLLGLNDLADVQRGSGASSETAGRQLDTAQSAEETALAAKSQAETKYTGLADKYDTLAAKLAKKQAAQDKYEAKHQDLIAAAEAAEGLADSQLGAEYLAGAEAGRSADPRAVQALEFALAQRGKKYVWSTEGPNTYDCSGLTYASYRSVGFNLERVSRDQYWQTRNKVVDRYSLLPGDLLFFSYSNSWRGIHHVAMYAGNGMMVEAPRTGLNVRLVPVRWTELFQATRVFGSVEGTTPGPTLGDPDPEPTETTPATKTPTTKPTTTSPTKTPTTKPTTTSPSTSPSATPTTTAPSSTPTSSAPTSASPTTSSASPTPDPVSTSSSASETSASPTTSDSGSSGSSSASGAASSSSVNATESTLALESSSDS